MIKYRFFIPKSCLIVGLVLLTILSACSSAEETELSTPTTVSQTTSLPKSKPQDEVVVTTVFSSSPLPESTSPIDASQDEYDSSTEYEIAMILAGQIMQSGNYREAIVHYDKAIELFPDKAVPYDARGSAYYLLSEYEKALSDYNQAIDADESYATAYYNRGRLLLQSEKYDAALKDLQRAITLSPDEFAYRANGNIGIIYHRQGEFERAIEAFDAAIDANDANADTYYLRGSTYAAMGNYPAAITDYQSAIARYPGYVEAYLGLGYAHYKANQLNQAETALQKVIDISPNLPEAYGYMALVRLAQNRETDGADAIGQAKILLAALPNREQTSIKDQLMEELVQYAKMYPDQQEVSNKLITVLSAP